MKGLPQRRGLLEGSQLQWERPSHSVSNSRTADGGGHAYSRGTWGDPAARTDVRGGHSGVHARQRGPLCLGHPVHPATRPGRGNVNWWAPGSRPRAPFCFLLPRPSEGPRAWASGGQGLRGPRARGVGYGLQGPPWGPAGLAQGAGRRGGRSPVVRVAPADPGGALWPTVLSAVFSPFPLRMTAPHPTGPHSACSPVGSDPRLPIFPQTGEWTQLTVCSLRPLPFILEKT